MQDTVRSERSLEPLRLTVQRVQYADVAELQLFTIYDHPTDFPDCFVVRRWFAGDGRPEPSADPKFWCMAATIEEARASIPGGLVCVPRQPEDDLRIVETWL